MGYGEYLRSLLRPLGLYEDAGVGAAELEAIGAALDESFSRLEDGEREALVITAESAGLEKYESILPYTPAYISTNDRRRAILALTRIDECSFTEGALNDAVAGCGIRAVVRETGKTQTVEVLFPYNRGIPEGFDALRRRIEEILPCHLGIDYAFVYTVWGEIAGFLASWRELEAEVGDWHEFEKYYGGEE